MLAKNVRKTNGVEISRELRQYLFTYNTATTKIHSNPYDTHLFSHLIYKLKHTNAPTCQALAHIKKNAYFSHVC